MQKLRTGYAYHGNRMINHAEEDLRDMAQNNCNLVVHMFSHNDWDRHVNAVKKMIAMTEELGMEVWVDNWGLGGPPGDKSHFLAYYPDSHVYYSNGKMDPVKACYNSKDFRQFTKDWIDVVEFIGGKTIFWDEPTLPKKEENGVEVYSCCCETCRGLFKEKYGYDMPETANEDVEKFRIDTIVDYFSEVTSYSSLKGIKNSACVMIGKSHGISLDSAETLCSLSTLDNIGTDPYWVGRKLDPYGYVYESTKKTLGISERLGKDHNIWIQTCGNPVGAEEDIVTAVNAAYDAGARTIISWAYLGSHTNDFGSKNPLVVRAKTADAYRYVWDRERERIIKEKRAEFCKF